MKPILFAIFAVIIYGTAGVVIEQKLGKFNTAALSMLFTLPFIPLAALFLGVEKARAQEILFPGGGLFWLTMALGAFYFLADYFYLGAFTAGGDAMTITTIILIAPVVTALVKHFWIGGYPNTYQIVGYAFAAVAMLLLAKGGAMQAP